MQGYKITFGLNFKILLAVYFNTNNKKDGKTYKNEASSEQHHKVLRAACLRELKCMKTILAFIANQFTQ
jgi:hypothetical protein